MKATIERRLDVLESALGPFCPHCTALAALSEEELDTRIQAFASGLSLPVDLPDPSPSCARCQETAGMSEEEIDAELVRLMDIIQEAAQYSSRQERQQATR